MTPVFRRVWTTASLAMYAGAAGCVYDGAGRVPADATRPVAAEIERQAAEIVAGRYLLLPHGFESSKQEWGTYSAKNLLAGSAWSGLAFGKGWSEGRHLNLTVVDLTTGRRANVFDRQVALGDWRASFKADAPGDLRYPDRLLLVARTDDTNGDGQIDDRDSAGLFVYNLASGERVAVTPKGHHLACVRFLNDDVVLVLAREPDRGATAVCMHNPVSGAGRMVIEDVTP